MAKLNLSKANRIVSRALALANERELNPLAIVVLDASGAIKAAQVQDGVPLGRFEVAAGKARGALFAGSTSRVMQDMAIERPHFIAGVASVLADGVVPVPGGVVMRTSRGEIVGAVGISGDTSDNDEEAAVAGIEAAGLVAGS